MNLSSADETTLVILALFIVLIGRRIVGMVRGAPARPARLAGFAVLFSALFVFTIAFSFFVVPLWTYALDAAVAAAAALGATWYVRRHVVFDWRNGEWYYRLHILIPALYLVLFAVRLVLDALVLGVNPFGAPPSTRVVLSGASLLTLVAVDGLFAFSTGLLVGRSAGVILEHRKKLAEGPPPPAARPPLAS